MRNMLFSVEFGSLSARSLTALWVTLSGPAHVVSVREGASKRALHASRRLSVGVGRAAAPPAADFTAEEERERGKEGARARALCCQSWRGEWAYPTTYLPYCPRSHAHIAHGDRAITSVVVVRRSN